MSVSQRLVAVGGALGVGIVGALVALALGPGGSATPHGRLPVPVRTAAVAHPALAVPIQPPADPRLLGPDLDLAQRVIDSPSAAPALVRRAADLEQLATGPLLRLAPAARRALLARLDPPAAAAAATALAAAQALAGVEALPRRLPPWRIITPPPPGTLLGDFRAAGTRFGVGWEYLAAIESIETHFGRVDGLSTAGAQGPMQFLPSTWATYGRGNINDPRDAIFAAARFLAANGARGDIGDALFHYNHSLGYVRAVKDYAERMRADPRAFLGYYDWQVIYTYRHGTVILPLGFPRVRPVPLG